MRLFLEFFPYQNAFVIFECKDCIRVEARFYTFNWLEFKVMNSVLPFHEVILVNT